MNGDNNMKYQAKRPKIGMMSSRQDGFLKVNHTYINAVWRAGGWCIPLGYTDNEEQLKAYAEMCDGFLFSGGVDVDPKYYGETIAFDNVEIDEMRDGFEMAMFPHALASGKPILGICRGIQVMNVCRGGTLYQHMDGHRQEQPGTIHEQKLHLTEGGYLQKLTGLDEIKVNTFHHQNIKDLAPGLFAEAVSEDGYIEAVYDPEHPFFVGVQFHPEIYIGQEDDDHSLKLFEAFMEACR